MNYYPFHIGDYIAHTAHLDPIEDCAYRRLLDAYYLIEGPLPADVAACARQTAIGKSTRQAMAIGMRLGYHGMIREIVSRLKTENGLSNARLCATGGYSKAVLAGSGLGFRIDPFLTLRGISRIYHLNKTQ